MADLADEADRATKTMTGRAVRVVRRHRQTEVLIEFEDGTRLFIDSETALDMSITGDPGE
jgi:hypothetical protein